MSQNDAKTLLTVFLFDNKRIIHHDYAVSDHTVNRGFYRNVLRPGWLWHHDNAPVHSEQLVQWSLARHSIPQLWHPLHYPRSFSSIRTSLCCGFWLGTAFPRSLPYQLSKNKMWHDSYWLTKKMSSKNASNNGNCIGLSVLLPIGTTLKEFDMSRIMTTKHYRLCDWLEQRALLIDPTHGIYPIIISSGLVHFSLGSIHHSTFPFEIVFLFFHFVLISFSNQN